MDTFEPTDSVEQIGQSDTMPADGPLTSDIHDRRLQRILDYQAHALANTKLLVSNLAAINSGLMWTALWLEEKIEEAIATIPVTVERMELAYKAIDMHLRVVRQIERFAQVELRAEVPRQASPKTKGDVDGLAGTTSGSTMGPSEDLNI